MPLNGFELQNHEMIGYVKCDSVPPIMIIAGPNGVGKSTVLSFIRKRMNGEGGPGSATFEGNPKPIYLGAHRSPAPVNLHRSVPVLTSDTTYRDTLRAPSFAFNTPHGGVPQFLTSGFERNRLAPDFAPYFSVKNKLIRYESTFNSLAGEVYKARGEVPRGVIPDIFEPLRAAVDYLLPGIKFEDVRLEGDYYKVYFKNRLGRQVEYDNLSSGEKDILAMLFPLIEQQIESIISTIRSQPIVLDDIVVLVDTPEAHLQAALQLSFLKYMRRSVEEAKARLQNLQFIMCTHSHIIINEATPGELFLMVYPDDKQGNQLNSVKEMDLNSLQTILGDLGLAALSTGKTLLLTEGPDDVHILRTLYPKLEASCTLLPLGGKSYISTIVDAFDKILSELTSRGIRVYALLDRDRGGIISSKSQTTKERIFTLPVTCMENLLIDIDSIYEVLKVLVNKERLESKGIRQPSDINVLLQKIISKEDYVAEEVKIRLNEDLRFNVNIQNATSVPDIEKAIDEVVAAKKTRVAVMASTVARDVREAIEKKDYDKLNGKLITGHIAHEFDLKREWLNYAVAGTLCQQSRAPIGLTQLLIQMRTATPLSL